MNKKIIEVIKNLGLSKNEVKTYLAGLELGETSVQRIAQKAKLHRTTTYRAIDTLKSKGLFLSSISKGHRKYSTEDPRKILDKIERQKTQFENVLPELLSLVSFSDKKPEIKYFEGEGGLIEIYSDTLEHPDSTIRAWVNSEALDNFKIDYLKEVYLPTRLKKRILVNAIAPATEEMKRYQSRDRSSLRQTKLLKNIPGFNVEIMIYGNDKIAIIDFKESLGLIIQNKNIFKTLKTIFIVNWDNLV